MYVCVCLAVTDGQIRRAIDNGACTRKQLVECFGVGRVCGKCNDDVKSMLTVQACDRSCGLPAVETSLSPAPWTGTSTQQLLATGISQ